MQRFKINSADLSVVICVVFMCSDIITQFMITLESFVICVQDVE
jgi:hypothetical protein